MIIKFKCLQCGDTFEKEEFEILEQQQTFRYCSCGGKLSVINLNDIVKDDLDRRVKANLTRYMNTLGIEGCIELIERNQKSPCTRLYIDILKEKGLWKKELV